MLSRCHAIIRTRREQDTLKCPISEGHLDEKLCDSLTSKYSAPQIYSLPKSCTQTHKRPLQVPLQK